MSYYSEKQARDCQLFVNEKIITDLCYFVDSDTAGVHTYHYYLTDFNRLIISRESTDYSFFSTYHYSATAYDLNTVNQKEISFNHKYKGSDDWHEISFRVKIDDIPYTIKIGSKYNGDIYDKLINHMKKYSTQQESSNPNKSRIAELRELYEDGILTKEELLNLLEK